MRAADRTRSSSSLDADGARSTAVERATATRLRDILARRLLHHQRTLALKGGPRNKLACPLVSFIRERGVTFPPCWISRACRVNPDNSMNSSVKPKQFDAATLPCGEPSTCRQSLTKMAKPAS